MKKLILSVAFAAFSLSANISANAAEVEGNSFKQTNFVANKKSYKPQIREKNFINGWGISIRPAGAGGHFWVTAKDVSYEYVGDVQNSADEKLRKLHTDDLKYVKLPVGGKDNFATGTVFNGGESFVITQGEITAPAKFLFASDGGVISAWTERKNEDGSFVHPSKAVKVVEEKDAQFFGLAINDDYSRIYAADFGAKPAVKVYDGKFKPLNIEFKSPFEPEYAPFNVQNLDGNIFVAYAKYLEAGEEDVSKPGYGRVAEFDEDGKLVATWEDGGKLSAPWGFAIAPKDFGKFSNALLVSNFGDGTIAAYDSESRKFIDYLRNEKGEVIAIEGIWGILFGNGASLGDKDALYFAAGPREEKDGLFGSLRLTK
jgi:uncharacterized protein (TIGR03118 family)